MTGSCQPPTKTTSSYNCVIICTDHLPYHTNSHDFTIRSIFGCGVVPLLVRLLCHFLVWLAHFRLVPIYGGCERISQTNSEISSGPPVKRVGMYICFAIGKYDQHIELFSTNTGEMSQNTMVLILAHGRGVTMVVDLIPIWTDFDWNCRLAAAQL